MKEPFPSDEEAERCGMNIAWQSAFREKYGVIKSAYICLGRQAHAEKLTGKALGDAGLNIDGKLARIRELILINQIKNESAPTNN